MRQPGASRNAIRVLKIPSTPNGTHKDGELAPVPGPVYHPVRDYGFEIGQGISLFRAGS
jgi:hypothetical protein